MFDWWIHPSFIWWTFSLLTLRPLLLDSNNYASGLTSVMDKKAVASYTDALRCLLGWYKDAEAYFSNGGMWRLLSVTRPNSSKHFLPPKHNVLLTGCLRLFGPTQRCHPHSFQPSNHWRKAQVVCQARTMATQSQLQYFSGRMWQKLHHLFLWANLLYTLYICTHKTCIVCQ